MKRRYPTVDDIKLTEMQRGFHDEYTNPDGENYENALASALAVGYSGVVAKGESHKWLPKHGHTPESALKLKSLARAIFFTRWHRQKLNDDIRERTIEKAVEKTAEANAVKWVTTREYVEGVMREIVERCMVRNERVVDGHNHNLAEQLALEAFDGLRGVVVNDKIRDKFVAVLSEKFTAYCRKYQIFKPMAAYHASRTLGVEIGMFNRVVKKTIDTPVDAMTLSELETEQKRLESEYQRLSAEAKKKGNGHVRAKH